MADVPRRNEQFTFDHIDNEHASSEQQPEFPESGLEAWLVVFGGFCALFLVFGMVNSTAVIQDYLASNQLHGSTPTRISWIFSVNLFLTFFLGIYSGTVFDQRGPKTLVALGSLALVLSMMLIGFCVEYWHFMLSYGVLGGLGGALLMAPAFASIGQFFNRRRGFATGIANTAGSVGGIVIPLMLQKLNAQLGFAWSTRILGFLFLTLAVPANLFLKRRLSPEEKPSLWPDMRILLHRSFATCALGMFLMEWGLFVVLAYVASYVTAKVELGISGYSIVALLNAGSFFGRWIPGLLADRYGRFNVIVVTVLMCSVSILALWLPSGDSKSLLIIFAIVFGFASGSNLGLIPVCLSQLCSPEKYGRYLSSAYFLTSFGTLTSIPIGGSILGASNNFTGLICFAGTAYFGALLCFVTSRGFAAGWAARSKF